MSLLSLSACLATVLLHVASGNSFELTLRRKPPGPEPVPRGQPHHIYKANVSADAAWTPCSPGQFPIGHWTSPADRATRTGSQLYGTVLAQRFIWAHQHPQNCSAAKFLLYHPHVSGIGSVVHHMGQALSMAIQLKRTMVLAPGPFKVVTFTATDRCGELATLDQCYFEPLSSCTWRDALKDPEEPRCIKSPNLARDSSARTVCFRGAFVARDYSFQQVAPQFRALLRESPLRPELYYYWWRAQSAAYIVRPNAATRNEIAARKQRLFGGERIRPGTVSVHVRHGDKFTESELVADGVYLRVARELLHAQGNLTLANAERLKQRIFLSTEDAQTVEAFDAQVDWDVQSVSLTRAAADDETTLERTREMGPYEDMLNSLLNLDLALQCDAFVGTLSSNWCRLIDELRSTVRCKAHAPYMDAQQESPPYDVNW